MRFLFLFIFFLLVNLYSFGQLSAPLQQLKKYAAVNKLDDFDSTYLYFDNKVNKDLHYLFPLYVTLLNEKLAKKVNGLHGYYDNASQFFSFAGDYSAALAYAVKAYDTLPHHIADDISVYVNDSLNGITHTDARKYILEKSRSQQVVMINEAHYKPLHKAFTLSLLDEMYKQGFRYLAMEAFSNLANRSLTSINVLTGHYITEPVGAELARRALQIGYTLVSYEDTAAAKHSGSERDAIQAANIYAILEKDPAARILVHAGYGHIYEEAFTSGYIPMALAFKKISGINPLTIDQTDMTEASNFEYGRIFYDAYIKKYPVSIPSVAIKNNQPLNVLDNTGVDLVVIHPETIYKNGRPTWYSLNGSRKETAIKPTEKKMFFVQAYYESEYTGKEPGGLIPADQTYTSSENGYYYLYLQPAKYKIIFRDMNYKVLSVKDLTVN